MRPVEPSRSFERIIWAIGVLLTLLWGSLFIEMAGRFGVSEASPVLILFLISQLPIVAFGWWAVSRRRKQTLELEEYEARMERLADILD